MIDAYYYASTLLRPGGRHVRRLRNNQDHAVVARTPHGFVLAVADGVSGRNHELYGRQSRTEVGAYLTAELAVNAAVGALVNGGDAAAIHQAMASNIAAGLAPLQLAGKPIQSALPCTLVVAVATARWTAVWCSGDGYWGAVFPPGRREVVSEYTDLEKDVLATDEGLCIRGGRHRLSLDRLASTSAVNGQAAVAEDLELVLTAPCGPVSLWVASDGLDDEPTTKDFVRRPIRSKAELEATLRYPVPSSEDHEKEMLRIALEDVGGPARSDDLAIAFLALRHRDLMTVLEEVV